MGITADCRMCGDNLADGHYNIILGEAADLDYYVCPECHDCVLDIIKSGR